LAACTAQKLIPELIPDASQIEHIVKRGVFELYKVKNETSEAQWVVNKIQEIVSLKNRDDIEGELNFEKIVVLARNKYLFKSLEEALQAANIPHYYKMTPGALKFESSLMQIFDRNGRAVVFVQLKNIWTKVFDERLIHIIGR
jgi:DNA helicase-2/ATP-dependent DNA helicase PcrA